MYVPDNPSKADLEDLARELYDQDVERYSGEWSTPDYTPVRVAYVDQAERIFDALENVFG